MMTARERAERALGHAPFLGRGKQAVLPFVEQEIIEAEKEERERCAKRCDHIAEGWSDSDTAYAQGRVNGATECAAAVRECE